METVIWLTTMIPPSMTFPESAYLPGKEKAHVVLVGD